MNYSNKNLQAALQSLKAFEQDVKSNKTPLNDADQVVLNQIYDFVDQLEDDVDYQLEHNYQKSSQ